jgi:mono/diheme cytochrome c family protein
LPPKYRIAVLGLLLAGACKPPPAGPPASVLADADRGKRAIERAGCGACHTIPGIDWPQGRTAPALGGLEGRALIAGRLPNRPDVVAAFVRDAPALVPDSAMPAMPLSEREARDVAAYLYAIGG